MSPLRKSVRCLFLVASEPDEFTASGHPERRRNRYLTRAEFRAWRNRAAVAFLLLAIVSAGAGFLGWRAGEESSDNLEQAGRDATTKTCLSGVDLRIAVAVGLDELRRLAVSNAPADSRKAFVKVTQPSIDRLLTQAAGKSYAAPLPPGTVSPPVIDEVRGLGTERCQRRTRDTFDRGG